MDLHKIIVKAGNIQKFNNWGLHKQKHPCLETHKIHFVCFQSKKEKHKIHFVCSNAERKHKYLCSSFYSASVQLHGNINICLPVSIFSKNKEQVFS